MATIVEPGPPSTARHSGGRRRRHLAGTAALIVLLAGCLTAMFTVWHLDRQYGPVRAGAFWAPQSDHDLTFDKNTFSYRLADEPRADARFVTSLDNLGAHSVTVMSIDTGDVATDIRWSTYRFVPGGFVSGENTPWHRFPAVVPPNGTIRLLITIRHPANCGARTRMSGVGTGTYSGDHQVHWKSLLHSHITLIRFFPGDEGILVC